MDEDIEIINQNTQKLLIKNFFKKNYKKILFLFSLLIFILVFFFSFQEVQDRKKNKLAEKFNNIIFDKSLTNEGYIKSQMIEIVNAKDSTYSILALYFLIENKLLDDEIEINKLFDLIISISKKEDKKLIIFKKALYNSDKLTDNEILSILQPIINSESIWKQHALLLMADVYFNTKQFNKSREFLNKILDLEISNQKIKMDVQKRLNRDFSE
tara:strand:- start:14 stop:652 length:639 start_codon:yes stop_codon:yes gene_type:complete